MSERQRHTNAMVSMPRLIIMGPHRMPRTSRNPKSPTRDLPAKNWRKLEIKNGLPHTFKDLSHGSIGAEQAILKFCHQ